MAYGTVKDIHIKGIVRAGADTVADDGAMNEIIGLEGKNGSLIPYYPSKRIYTLYWEGSNVKIDRVLVHKTSTQTNYIYIGRYYPDDKYGAFWASEEDTKHIEDRDVNLLMTGDIKDVVQIGDMLCFSMKNDTNKYYRFNGTTYEDYVNDFNDLPPIHFSVGLGIYNKDYYESHGYPNMYIGKSITATIADVEKNSEDHITIEEKIHSYRTTAKGLVRESGGLTGMFMAVYAYRLNTGEYVRASNPVLLNIPNSYRRGKMVNGTYEDNFLFTAPDGSQKELYERDVRTVTYGYRGLINTTKTTKEVVGDYYGSLNGLQIPCGELYSDGFYSELALMPSKYSLRERFIAPRTTNLESIRYTSIFLGNYLSVITDGRFDEKYKDYIDKLCVFISPEIDTDSKRFDYLSFDDDFEYGTLLYHYDSQTYTFRQKTDEELKDEIFDISSFYLVDEIPYSELCGINCPISRDKKYKVNLVGKLGDNLLVREQLPSTAFNNVENRSGNLFVMNGRLHQYDFLSREYVDELVSDYEDYPGKGQIGYDRLWEIDDKRKMVYADCQIVVNKSSNIYGQYRSSGYMHRVLVMVDKNGVPIPMNNMLSYPDNRADSVVLLLTIGGVTYRTEANLRKFNHLNLAAYINSEFNPIEHTVCRYTELPVPVPELKEIFPQPKTMAVSEVNLPTYFRPINEIQFGDGEIIGLSSFAMPMSQDQYGAYTLIAFCSDGIFSANVDRTGVNAYDYVTVFPSREVCLGRDTICQIDGAIVFASNKGLALLNHNGSSLYCEELIGDIRMLPSTDKQSSSKGNYLYGLVTNGTKAGDKETVDIDSSISRENIIEMIGAKGTHVSYMSQRNKILISNGNYDYCYSIDIPTRVCTKYPIRIVCGDKNIPSELYYADYGDIDTVEYKFDNVDYFSGNSRVLVQSRPIKTSELLRGTYRVIANGHFCAESTNVYCEMLVLGSLDGHSWHRIGLKEKNASKPFNNLGVTCFGATWNFIMVIISGELSYGSHIDGITIQSEPKYNNKLK